MRDGVKLSIGPCSGAAPVPTISGCCATTSDESEPAAGGRSPIAVPRSRRSHISRSVATDSSACSRPNMPDCRSLTEKGSDSSSERSSVIQYEVVCISFSGSSSLPSPIFSLVKNLIFLKPTTWERTRTSPWEKEEVEVVKEVEEEEGAACCAPTKEGASAWCEVAAISKTRTWV